MALTPLLVWKNRDSSRDLITRFKNVINKGFTDGGLLTPVGGTLEVDIDNFVCVTSDGAVVVSNAVERVITVDAVVNYVCLRARYVDLGSFVVGIEVLDAAAYTADPDQEHLHVIATVDLSAGGFLTVPTTAISYVLRDEVDKQGRSFWRDHVATQAALPTELNREGDVRLALDTGSLYWWDGVSAWNVFDEVPLQVHRDHEHTNGITGDSDASTIIPTVVATDMSIGAVPAGSAYTANGRHVTAPGAPLLISAPGVGALRGLIQVALDQTGASIENYRVTKDADPLDIAAARIVDISDSHPVGTFTLLFDFAATTLSWNAGPAVPVVTGNTYVLYSDDGLSSITVDLVGALPGLNVSDNYTTAASLQVDTSLLVGYWFWDGAVVLTLGKDKRVFGNLGAAQLTTTFKQEELYAPNNDLRGYSLVSGGEVTNLTGIDVRVQGPVICYIAGQRIAAPGAYSGITLTDNATNVIYIDSAGALQQTTASIGTLSDFIPLASVVTIAGAISSNTDLRIPQLVIGTEDTREVNLNVAPNTVLRFLKGSTFDDLRLERGGSITNTRYQAGYGSFTVQCFGTRVLAQDEVANESALWTDDAIGGALPHRFYHDDILNNIYLHQIGSDEQVEPHMLGSATPNLIGGLRFAETARKYNRGVISGLVCTRTGPLTVEIGVGSFVDNYGRLVEVVSPVPVSLDLGDSAYIVYWDPATTAWSRATMTTGISIDKTPVGAPVVSGATIINMNSGGGGDELDAGSNVRRFANGENDRSHISVGVVQTDPLTGDNFGNIEEALLYLNCFKRSAAADRGLVPKKILVSSTQSLAAGIDFSESKWTQAVNRLYGISFEGNSYTQYPVSILWSTQEPLFGSNSQLHHNWTFSGFEFTYTGAANGGDDTICVMRNPGPGLQMRDCSFNGLLTHLINWDDAVNPTMGGDPDTGLLPLGRPTIFEQCAIRDAASSSNTGTIFYMENGMSGQLIVRDCDVTDNSYFWDYMFEVVLDSSDVDILVENTLISQIGVAIFFHNDAQFSDARKTLQNCDIDGNTQFVEANNNTDNRKVNLLNCRIGNSGLNLRGANLVQGCYGKDDSLILGHYQASVTDCNFFEDSRYQGEFAHILNSRVRLESALTTRSNPSIAHTITGSVVANKAGRVSNRIVTLASPTVISDSYLYHIDQPGADTDSWIRSDGGGDLTLSDCKIGLGPDGSTFASRSSGSGSTAMISNPDGSPATVVLKDNVSSLSQGASVYVGTSSSLSLSGGNMSRVGGGADTTPMVHAAGTRFIVDGARIASVSTGASNVIRSDATDCVIRGAILFASTVTTANVVDLISGTSATVSNCTINRVAASGFHVAHAVTKATVTGNVAVGAAFSGFPGGVTFVNNI